MKSLNKSELPNPDPSNGDSKKVIEKKHTVPIPYSLLYPEIDDLIEPIEEFPEYGKKEVKNRKP